MQKNIALLISYVFHPLFVPFYGLLIFLKTTTFLLDFGLQYQIGKLVLMLTVLFPVVLFLFIKNRKLADDVFLAKTEQRKIPLLFNLALLSLLIFRLYIFPELIELRMFFYGLLISNLLAFIFLYLKTKVSLHTLYLSNVFFYLLSFSIFTQAESRIWLVLSLLVMGLVGSCRMYLKAHRFDEIVWGFVLPLATHLALYVFWQ
ncbi:MAG: hypothetical protein KKC03_04660 [Bacteroidetes bacterium]|nr:hypothetical protein [Bacteroidota bacterium]